MPTESPSKPGVKKEKLEKKEAAASQPAELSAKEKAASIAEKEKTQQRIDKLETRLAKCLEFIGKLPAGQIQKTAKEKYKQAKKILNKAAIDLKNAVSDLVVKIATGLEEHEKKMTQRIEDLKKIGVSEEYAKKYLFDNKCEANEKLGLDKMVAFLLEANKMGVNPDDAFNMWKYVWHPFMKESELIKILKDMKEIGINDNFYAVYQNNLYTPCKVPNDKKEAYKKTAAILDAIKISTEELNKFYGRYTSIPAEELSRLIAEMRKQGITKNFYEIYCVSRVINSNYKKISSFLEFKKENTPITDILELCSLQGQTDTIKAYMKAFIGAYSSKTNEDVLAYAIEAYKAETNIDKAMGYISFLESQGIDGLKYFRVLREFLPSTKDIERISEDDIAELEAMGLDKVSAIILAKEKSKDAIPLDGESRGTETFVESFNHQRMKEGGVVILYLLSNGDVDYAKNMLQSGNADDILKGGEKAVLFTSILRKVNMSGDDILTMWSVRSGPIDRKNIAKINRASEIAALLNGIALMVAGSPFTTGTVINDNAYDLTNAAHEYAKFDQTEIKGFVDDLFARHAEVTMENLATFLRDPTLPLCIEVSKVLGNSDREKALQIGRSLYFQGMTVLPDAEILALEIKEWEVLQASVDKEKLWEGTNVIALFNNEKWENGDWRFNDEEKKENLKKSIGPNGSLDVFAPSEKPTPEELRKLKTDLLNRIATTPPPMRFFFDGHGDPERLWIVNGQVENGKIVEGKFDTLNVISIEELAEATAKRRENFPDKLALLAKDVYIFASCMNNQFMRAFYENLKKQGGIAPRSIGESEYGQYGFSLSPRENSKKLKIAKLLGVGNLISPIRDPKGDKFKIIYGLGEVGTTLGDIRKNEKKYTLSNMTIYAPTQSGQPQQVSRKEKDKNNSYT